jgi:hypothetical protein
MSGHGGKVNSSCRRRAVAALWRAAQAEKDDGIPALDCGATVSTVPLGRMGFYRTIPDTSCLAYFLRSFGASQGSASAGNGTRKY